MTPTHCPCGTPTTGPTICPACELTASYALANIALHHRDATDTTRPDHGTIHDPQAIHLNGRTLGGVAATRRTQTLWDTWATLAGWCRVIMENRPPIHGPLCPDHCLHVTCAHIRRHTWPQPHTRSMIAYLARHLHWATNQRWAPEMLDELLNVENRLRRLVDIPAPRWYAGRCDTPDLTGNTCGAELYATTDTGTIDCPGCGWGYDIATRRDTLLEQAADHKVTVTTAVAALLAWTDYDGNSHTLTTHIRGWHQAGRLITYHGLTETDTLYRLGDIQELLIEHAQRQQQRRMRAPDGRVGYASRARTSTAP